jgi:hypothetical protein
MEVRVVFVRRDVLSPAVGLTTKLLAGRIDMSIAPLPGLIAQQIEADNVRALGLASAQRGARLPSIPTIAEAGIAGVEADAWAALFAPADPTRHHRAALAGRRNRARKGLGANKPRQAGYSGGAHSTHPNRRHAAGRGKKMGWRHQGGAYNAGLSCERARLGRVRCLWGRCRTCSDKLAKGFALDIPWSWP